ncbi:hypothetical protein RE628_28685 [Paenibacillus sp. D2_2]|uniref:NHL domain-containing protein n=1 Tax=Paenibacillus sp. D2_2 TaxID=3073092 RepID=UPI002815709B|nr:hypothetical protein [Paenibacillus sp. D2_2]WMT40992.1 hypothetical protein RE628_28685 [Paenibacillus sp. D2_2]
MMRTKFFKGFLIFSLMLQLFINVFANPVAQAASLDIRDNYTISTVAGTGVAGNGEKGLDLYMAGPQGIALDSAGNIYFAEFSSHRVRKLAPNGQVTTVAGNSIPGSDGMGGAATAGQLYSPRGIVLLGHKLYIADQGSNTIKMVDLDTGILTKIAGTGTAGFADGPAANAQFNSPYAIDADTNGNLYIADYSNYRIRKIDKNGNVTTVAGNGTQPAQGTADWVPNNIDALSAKLLSPVSIKIDKVGNIYFGTNANLLQKVDASGKIWNVIGNGSLGDPNNGATAASVAFAPPMGLDIKPGTNEIYITTTFSRKIYRLDAAGKINTVVGRELIHPSIRTMDLRRPGT